MSPRKEYKESHAYFASKIDVDSILKKMMNEDNPNFNRFNGISSTSFAGYDSEFENLYIVDLYKNAIKTIPTEEKTQDESIFIKIESIDEAQFACIQYDKIVLRSVETGGINKVISLPYSKKPDISLCELTSVKKSVDGNFLLVLTTEKADTWKYAETCSELPFDERAKQIDKIAHDDGFVRSTKEFNLRKSHIFIIDIGTYQLFYIQPQAIVKDIALTSACKLILALEPGGLRILNVDMEAQQYNFHSAILENLEEIAEVHAVQNDKLITISTCQEDDDYLDMSLHIIDLGAQIYKINETKKIATIGEPNEYNSNEFRILCNSIVFKEVEEQGSRNYLKEYLFGKENVDKLSFKGKDVFNFFCKLTDDSLVLGCRNQDKKPEFLICKLNSVNEYQVQYKKELKQEHDTLAKHIDSALYPAVEIPKDVISIITQLTVPNRLGLFTMKNTKAKEIDSDDESTDQLASNISHRLLF